MRRALLVVLGMTLAACADNAVLELRLDLPSGPGTFAYVQARSADTIDFDGDWAGADASDGFPLTATTSMQNVSFVTSGAAMTRPLGVRVRFCSDHVCGAITDTNAQEAHYVIQRAFYRGQRTTFTITPVPMPMATATTTTVQKCQVAGCTTGTATSYCYMDGRHFCE